MKNIEKKLATVRRRVGELKDECWKILNKAKVQLRGFNDLERRRYDLLTDELRPLLREKDDLWFARAKMRRETRNALKEGTGKRSDVWRGNLQSELLYRHGPAIRKTCFHEAGHAVADVLLGVGVLDVRLDTGFVGGSCTPERADSRVQGITSAAGRAAEQLAGFDVNPLSQNYAGDYRDAEGARNYYGVAGEATVLRNAKALLTRHWPAVKAVADAVMREGELSGQECGELIHANLDLGTRQRLTAA